MIQYQSNISQVVRFKIKQLEDIKNPDQMLRTVAAGVLPELKRRVHIEGRDTAGGQIGTYSPGYMVLRTGAYKNADTYKKGAKVGKNKNSGVFTKRGFTKFTQEDEDTVTSSKAFLKVEYEKKARPQYNRTSDTKVILSLTRQMENDLSIVASKNGYGIGFKNPENFRKSQYNEKTYKKRIWGLTEGEKKLAVKIAEDYIEKNLNS